MPPRPRRLAAVVFSALALGVLPARAAEADTWYPFKPDNSTSPSGAISLADWSPEPAGKHGRIVRRGDALIYNGRAIKLWGANLGFSDSKPTKAEAERMAAFFQKFGLNALRHHKHLDGPGSRGFQSETSSVRFDPEGLDRFDYFNLKLKEAGIFIKHSPTFGVRFGRDDLPRVPYHAEFGKLPDRPGARLRAPFGAVYLGEEIQDLQIDQTVNFLKHRNPYTKLRYADDPFLFCVELFNEDSVLFGGTNRVLQQSPTLRARSAKRFSAYLVGKYKTEAAWRSAWGAQIVTDPASIANADLRNLVDPGRVGGRLPAESLAAGTVVPWASPWFNDAAMDASGPHGALRTRLLDSMVFLISLQNEFYDRFTAAVRATGFDGEIVTSNWQAGSLVGHLLNLHSDARSGLVDRHNYFGGAGNEGIKLGKNFRSGSMLARPGMGNLSAGFQQVDNAAFMLSEWTHVQPNEWYAEGPALMGAYGWGLQGWDVSYFFQMGTHRGRAADRLGRNLWDGTNPVGLATFPAVSRMVRRLDVTEAPATHTLKVHAPSLAEGKFGFSGTTVQDHDAKSFSTDKVPTEALAVTRVAVRFTDTYEETPAFDLAPHRDGETLVSATKQLRWTPGSPDDSASGHVTINTPATKGFIGFAPGDRAFDLGDGFSITPAKGFAVILLTARGEKDTLAAAREIIVTAMARGRNTGMGFNDEGNVVLNLGAAPILLEPVKARLAVPFSGTLELLDHDGNTPTSSRAFRQSLALDGTEDRTPYYLIRR